MKKLTLKESYASLNDFIATHEISPATVADCFGNGYFVRNPRYSNDQCITKLLRYFGILTKKAKTQYPTADSVEFRIVDCAKPVQANISMPVLESMAAIFKYSYSGPMVGKEEGEYLSWHELSCQEKALLTEEMYNAIVTAYKISGN